MQEIYVEKIKKVLKNKSKLEKELRVKITNKGKNAFVDGNAEYEFIAIKVLQAINLGFSIENALFLKNEDRILQTLNIKNLTKRRDLGRIKARIIGTHGKTLKTLKNLTNCIISLSDNQVGIIGDCEEIEHAVQAFTSLVHGSRQGNVYARLEKQRKRKRLENSIEIRNS